MPRPPLAPRHSDGYKSPRFVPTGRNGINKAELGTLRETEPITDLSSPAGQTRDKERMGHPALLRAFEHYKAGRLDDAAELLRAYLGDVPGDASASHLLGGIYYRQGKHVAAREILRQACSAP